VVLPPYWEVERLVQIAEQGWEVFDGRLAAQGIDPLDLNLRRFCNLIYTTALEAIGRSGKEEDIEKFERELRDPPADLVESRPDVAERVVQEEMALFGNLAGSQGFE
jgi:hypothetical protein